MFLIKNLVKIYRNKDGSRVKALRGVNLELDKTGITFVCGESGNGKSTLLNLLAGLDNFDSGDIIFEGKSFKTFTDRDYDDYRRTKIGFVFDDNNLVDSMSVKENIKLAGVDGGIAPTDEDVAGVLKKVRLSGYEDRTVTQLSAGQRQRISIARVLIKSPKVLFMDEPTAHLDDKNKEIIWGIVQEIANNCLVLCVTHDMEIVREYADRKIVLEENVVGEDLRFHRVNKKDQIDFNKEIKENKKNIDKPKHSHGLDFKYSFKLGLANLFNRRWKTVFMVILCTFAVTFFALFAVLSSYDSTYALANSISATRTPYVSFRKGTSYSYEALTNEQFTSIDNVLGDYTFLKYTTTSLNISYNETTINVGHRNAVTGVVQIEAPVSNTQGSLNNLGQKILYGAYPKNATERQNGIVISDYLLGLIRLYGLNRIGTTDSNLVKFVGTDDEYRTSMNNNSVIGKYILINGNAYKVLGVYETDYTSFINSATMKYYSGEKNIYNYNLDNVYGAIHVSKDFIGFSSDSNTFASTSIIIGARAVESNSINNPENSQDMFDIIKAMGRIGYNIDSPTSGSINDLSTKIEVFKSVIMIFSVFTGLFAIVMMYYFISQMMDDSKKEVGVLKALGFTNRDICGIFMLATATFVVISFFATLIVTSISASVAGHALTSEILANFNLMSINFAVVGWIFLVCLGISALGVVIPLLKFAKKKPSQIIRGFK